MMRRIRKNSGKEPRNAGSVVISSRARLARNVEGARFPDWSGDDERVALGKRLGSLAIDVGDDIGRNLACIELSAVGADAEVLCEKGFVSSALLDRGAGAMVACDEDECDGGNIFSVMINEEDHIRIQCVRSGYDLDSAYDAVDEFDTAFGEKVRYAYSPKLGYLTACPSNLGTGMRASVEVALPALLLLDEFDAVSRAVTRLRFNVRGRQGEGSAVSSGIVQISNGGTLGVSEKQAIKSLKEVVDEVVKQELSARRFILEKKPVCFIDYFSRALAMLQSSFLIGSDEAGSCVAAVALGVELGAIKGIKADIIERLRTELGHATVKSMAYAGEEIEFRDREEENDAIDESRASIVRSLMRKARINEKFA